MWLGGYTPVGIPEQVAFYDVDTSCSQTLFANFPHLTQACGVLQINYMLLHVPTIVGPNWVKPPPLLAYRGQQGQGVSAGYASLLDVCSPDLYRKVVMHSLLKQLCHLACILGISSNFIVEPLEPQGLSERIPLMHALPCSPELFMELAFAQHVDKLHDRHPLVCFVSTVLAMACAT